MFLFRRAANQLTRRPAANLFAEHQLPASADPYGRRRTVHTCLPLTAKLFVDNENRYAHRILQNYDHYHVVRSAGEPTTIAASSPSAATAPVPVAVPCADVEQQLTDTHDWTAVSGAELVALLQHITQYCARNSLCISDDRFDRFVDAFCAQCFDLPDDQLLAALLALAHLPETPSLNTKNFLELWSVLDDACCARIFDWPIERILLTCDHWYLLNLGKVNKFNWNAAKKLGRKIRKLSAPHLVQTMFYTNLLRNPIVEMIDFEMNMSQSVGSMRLDEIAVMCMGFFKTQTTIKSPQLITELYARLQAEIDTVPDIGLVNVLKMLRYSSRIPHVDPMRCLLDACVPQVGRLSLLSCLHVMLLGTDLQLCHAAAIEACLQRFADAPIADVRLKDMERIAFVLGLFNYRSPSGVADVLSERFLGELKNRVPEIMRYPRCLPACLQYLSYRGWADAELISTVLDEQYCRNAYGRNVSLGRELFGLDSYAKIDLRETYDGRVLDEKRRRQMGIILVHYIPTRDGGHKLSATDKILLEMMEAVQVEIGPCRLAHVLPHFERPDLIVAYDRREGRALDIGERFPKLYGGAITWRSVLLGEELAADDNVVLFNFIVGGWNNYVRNEERLIGLLEQKRSQSVQLGYRPIVVPWYEWSRLTVAEQTLYVRRLVERSLAEMTLEIGTV